MAAAGGTDGNARTAGPPRATSYAGLAGGAPAASSPCLIFLLCGLATLLDGVLWSQGLPGPAGPAGHNGAAGVGGPPGE